MGRFSVARGAGVLVAALALSAAAQASTLTFSGTVLMGATGVQVGSNLYDVSFGDQALASGDFFPSAADNYAAGTALYESLLGAYQTGGHQVTAINGCTQDCLMAVMSSSNYQGANNYASYVSFVHGAGGVPKYMFGKFVADPGMNLASVPTETWTHWSVSPVPEPQTYAMLLAGLGLIGAMVRRSRGK